MSRPVYTLVLCCVVAALAGCETNGTGDGSGAALAETHAGLMCRFESFSVDITQGPSAGLSLAGPIYAVEDAETGRLFGALETADGEIEWTGQYEADGRISVTFHVGDELIVGQGPITGELCGGGAPIEGIAVGPKMAGGYAVDGTDVGHWLLSSPLEVYAFSDVPYPGSLIEDPAPTFTPGTGDTTTNATYRDENGRLHIISRNGCTGCGGTIQNGTCNGDGTSDVAMCLNGASYTVPQILEFLF